MAIADSSQFMVDLARNIRAPSRVAINHASRMRGSSADEAFAARHGRKSAARAETGEADQLPPGKTYPRQQGRRRL